jgi:hypothetical protein
MAYLVLLLAFDLRAGFAVGFTVDLGARKRCFIIFSTFSTASGPSWYSCFIVSLCSYQRKGIPDQMPTNGDAFEDSNTPENPPPPPLPPSIEGNKNGIRGNDEGNRDYIYKHKIEPKHWTQYAEAICAIALVAITFYYTRAAFRQAKASETAANAARDAVGVASSTLTETQVSNGRQAALADAARKTSEAESKQALDATIDNFHQDQRAWVATIDISGTPVKDTQWVVTVRAKNTGKTFAKKFHLVTGTSMGLERPDFSPVDKYREDPSKTTSISLLSPGGEYVARTALTGEGSEHGFPDPAQADIDRMKAGFPIFVYGKMSYVDVFGVSHWSTYCSHLTRQLAWENCSYHNDADEDQIKKKN